MGCDSVARGVAGTCAVCQPEWSDTLNINGNRSPSPNQRGMAKRDLDPTRRSGRGVTDGRDPCQHRLLSRIPGARWRLGRGAGPAEIRDRISGFHTDFTQTDRSGPSTPRRPGQPHNAQMPMKSQITATSAGFPAPRPPLVDNGEGDSESRLGPVWQRRRIA